MSPNKCNKILKNNNSHISHVGHVSLQEINNDSENVFKQIYIYIYKN